MNFTMNISLDKGAFEPIREHPTDAGADLRTPIDFILWPHKSMLIDTGVHIELPHNTVGLLTSKSGLYTKKKITTTGTIDEGYTGSIKVQLLNHSDEKAFFHTGDKITQLLIMPVEYVDFNIVDAISGGERGDNGFGSTGK